MDRPENRSVDRVLLFAIVALSLIGIVMVYSASYGFAIEATGSEDPGLFLRNHIIRVVLGFMLLILFPGRFCWRPSSFLRSCSCPRPSGSRSGARRGG